MKFMSCENLVLYGAGKCAERCIEELALPIDKIKIVSSLGGEVLLGKKVKSWAKLELNVINKVIIASEYVAEIYDCIVQSGIKVEDVYCFVFEDRKLVKVTEYLRTKKKQKTLYAFYDLELNGATFDACVFANGAEEERLRKGLEHLCFVIVPPIKTHGNAWYKEMYSTEDEYKDRVRNLLIPIFHLIPSCISCIELVDRGDVIHYKNYNHIYPTGFDETRCELVNIPVKVFEKDKPVGHFCAPERAKNYINQVFNSVENKIILTFTIREYCDQPFRNNNLDELKMFLLSLDLNQYFPIIVRDTSHAGIGCIDGFEDYFHMPEAALDLGVRCALYEQAHLSFFVNNGATSTAFFNRKASYVVFKFSSEELECTSQEYLKEIFSLEFSDETFFFASGLYQKICWEDDTKENMEKYLNRFLELNKQERVE